jgi:hypothetical protein
VTSPDDRITIALARMRRDGWLPLAALSIADAEERVSRAGRQVFLSDGANSERIAVLRWRDVDPAPSQQPPRLARRVLSRAATKVLVIVYALLADPGADRQAVTTDQVLAVIKLLTSRPGNTWAVPALQVDLPIAGLTSEGEVGWGPGPVMQAWDQATRDVMALAARQLWEHPSWPRKIDG